MQVKLKKKHLTQHVRRAQGITIRHAHKFIISRWDNIRDVRRHVIIWLVSVAALIALVGGQMIWLQRNYMTIAPVKGGVYAEAVNGPVDTLNPLYAVTAAELASSKLLFSSLLDYDASGHLKHDVAANIKMEPNELDYTVTLRPNAKWHDGMAVTVKDVLFTVNLMKDPTTRAVPSLRIAWKDVTVTQLGETAVRFTLPNPNAAFPHALTFALLPEHILKEVKPHMLRESAFSNHPVGSGPFQMRRLQSINQAEGRKIIHMSAFSNYYEGEPKLNRFQLHVYGSNKAILAALRTNEVNAAADIDVVDMSQIDRSHYTIMSKPVNSGVYALLNTTSPILRDKVVRQSLQSATDTAAIRQRIGGGREPMDLPFANSQLGRNDIPKAPAYDIVRASTQLDLSGWRADSGVRSKDGQPLKLRLVTVKSETYQRAAEELARQWKKVGVGTEIVVIDPEDTSQDFTEVLRSRDYDVLINQLAIGADPDVYAYWHSSQATELGKNYSNYSNSISDTALSGALTRSDPVLRDARYKSFARQWLEDAPAIGLYQANMYYVHAKESRTISPEERIISPTDRYGSVIRWTVDTGLVYKTP